MMAADEDLSLFNGRSFKNFAQFEEFLRKRSKAYEEKWSKDRGGRSVESTNKQLVRESNHYPKAFKYVVVNYRCIHGGTHVSHSKIRKRRSHKLGCEVKFRLVADKAKKALVVTRAFLQHNHGKNPPLAGEKSEKASRSRYKRRSGALQKLVIVRKTEPSQDGSQIHPSSVTSGNSSARPDKTRQKQNDSEEEAGSDQEIANVDDKKSQVKHLLKAFVRKRKSSSKKEDAALKKSKKVNATMEMSENINAPVAISNLRKQEYAKAVCIKLLSALVTCPQEVFATRLNALTAIASQWGCGREVGSIKTGSDAAEPLVVGRKVTYQERTSNNSGGVARTERNNGNSQNESKSVMGSLDQTVTSVSDNYRASESRHMLDSQDFNSNNDLRVTGKRTSDRGREEELRKSVLPFVPKVKITGNDTGMEVTVMERLKDGKSLVSSQTFWAI